MAIYDKPVRLLFRDMIEDWNLQVETIFSRQESVDWFKHNYPKIKTGTVTAHLIRLSTNASSRVHYNAKPQEDDLFYQIDGGHFRLYDSLNDPAPIYESSSIEDNDEADISSPIVESKLVTEFAYEKDLQNFLAKNLQLIEPSLQLYEEEDIKGIEYPVGGRFIDILAVDSSNNLVVIELKVSRGYDRVVGQILRYMGWISENLAEENQQVRGIIIAREISNDLLLSCSRISDIQLFEYSLSVSLNRRK